MANGNDSALALRAATSVTRFWLQVDRRGRDECWPWLGLANAAGYGRFTWDGRNSGAHELALTFASGECRPAELETCHSCNNPPCCNPRHLRFDTSASNNADCVLAQRHHHGEQHHRAKITDADAGDIRRRLAAGEKGRTLAAEYGVTPSVISKVRNGRSWKHVAEPTLIPFLKEAQ